MSTVTPPSEEIDLLYLLGELVDHWKSIVTCISTFMLSAALYLFIATPVWQAGAMIHVELKQENALLSGLKQALNDARPSSAAEIILLQSRMILGETVDELGLQIHVIPEQFPVLGKVLARLTGDIPGNITINDLVVTGGYRDKTQLLLTVLDRTHFRISGKGFQMEGVTGRRLEGHGVSLLVSSVNAKPGTRFTVDVVSRLEAITALQQRFSVTEKGKETGMLSLTLTGDDPAQTVQILNTIMQRYLAQNIARQAEKDENSLAFMEQKLPEIRTDLDLAEDRLSAYRKENDSVDLSLEAKSILEQIVNVDNQLNELTFREAEISQRFRREHPIYRALLEKQDVLQKEKSRLNRRISAMPSTQQSVLSLSRDVESGRLVYQQLLNRQQELNIARAAVTGNARVIDEAVTFPETVQPKKMLVMVMALLTGIMVSVGGILLRMALRRGVMVPEQLEEEGIRVYASIPLSTHPRKWQKWRKKKYEKGLLATRSPENLAVEALRNLCTGLHFVMQKSRSNVLIISGASPGAGKTFISSNLAQVMAASGKKVLLIDADLRRGYLHQLFSERSPAGLAEILAGTACLQQTKIALQHEGFDYIGRGGEQSAPAERLMSPRFADLLEQMSVCYDLIIVDTPPVLAVTDAVIVGRHAGTVMLVARAGVDSVKDILNSVKRFEQSGVTVKGCILNGVVRKYGDYYRYGTRQYDYTLYRREENSP